ncbi:TetR/AcrR family transcriptional regulator [Rhodococcus fascians]|nr:TetR/AcrR family transcriptional regulator [Rhodococcus fascians]MBY4237868.1 TetR/AcrR family transcriptional regulator [Rhodococcus fascians]MBY4253381.1 TetR/AcrR family transcriptional regulator [Rhodococcus fascians]MBY4269018.1 TetR/AcrR family transcriptional regulator [Rhodococcus fascians]MBY4275071.1 TetR/AcrR family transcriptional regulator [Rhodococcus fascians]
MQNDRPRGNSRGERSRSRLLDAAEMVMSRHGYLGATIPRIVAAAGIPLSSIYHFYGSKDGLLEAVLERGGRRLNDAIPGPPPGLDKFEAATYMVEGLCAAVDDHPHFFQLLTSIVDVAEASPGDRGIARARQLRELGLTLLRARIAAVFDIGVETELATTLAQFSRAAIDGALLAVKVDGASLAAMLAPLPTALVAIHAASTTAQRGS